MAAQMVGVAAAQMVCIVAAWMAARWELSAADDWAAKMAAWKDIEMASQ